MLDLISPMSQVMLSWSLFFLLFSGLGMAILKLLGKRIASGRDWLDSFWLGWALALAVLQIWHFIFPVNEMILLLLAVVAAYQLFSQRETAARLIAQLRYERAYLLAMTLLAPLDVKPGACYADRLRQRVPRHPGRDVDRRVSDRAGARKPVFVLGF